MSAMKDLPAINVSQVRNEKEREEVFMIRRKVFVEEQQVAPDEEYDEFENTSTHYIATIDDMPAGTARWRETGSKVKLERFAVLKEYRGKGIGKALVNAVVSDAGRLNKPVYLHAQLPVIKFYEKHGFKAEGKIFEEAGILHRIMFLGSPAALRSSQRTAL
ncbi:MAG: GNAT family N-acetyltransferase [Bacteroidia bacterium]